MSSKKLQEMQENGFVSKAQRLSENEEKKEYKLTPKRIILRILLSVFTVVLCLIIALFALLYVLVNGGCQPLRERLVLSATQASATKWLPGLFMPQSEVDKIIEKSYVVNTDVMSLEEYEALSANSSVQISEDEWENAIDGMIFEKITGTTFTGYILLVKDPSRVFVGTSSDFKHGLYGMNVYDMAKKEDAVAVVNAGEFADPGGQGTGNTPLGLTYSKGEVVWNDNLRRTFIGFDSNNKLIVRETMSKADAELLGIRDAVSFQWGNVLITNDEDGNITMHYADNNTGTAQRTSIGQRADGTVIFIVTDGRSASSLGATRNDIIDVMVQYGAISAGMLDGGSSSLMYYEDYYTKYGYDYDKLDDYQKQGLVNKYKAFTPPRLMPTYFCIAREDTESEG